MSSLTRCNHCLVNSLASRAARTGKFLKIVNSDYQLGGKDIHIVGHREVPGKENWVAWVMSLPTTCQC